MYNHIKIEKKWSQYWRENKTFKFKEDFSKRKFYVLDMFPYPSGAGLHVGHPKGYTASDIVSRYKRLNNFSVLHPIGWDAFGLPAEQYAIQTGNHPKVFTYENIKNFRQQLQRLGFDFDYDKEVCTCDKNFYKWTQWIFIQLYKQGLAKIENADVNWCEDLKIVLANEEIIKDKNGNFVSERGNHPVVKKKMKQWVLKITEFAEELINGLDDLDWNENLKNIQKKWIGKNEGLIINFSIENKSEFLIPVFINSKIENIFNVAFIAIAADSNYVEKLIADPSDEILNFIRNVKNQKDYERIKEKKEPFGIYSGINCINPINNEAIPIYLVDYVLSNYGSGITIGNPLINTKDESFIKKYEINFKEKEINQNSKDITIFLKNLNLLKKIKTYKLKDWLFSRQRYWGEPFPILFNEKNEILIDENLPVELPELTDFSPSSDGNSPLKKATDWLNVKIENINYKRDTNTMPQWAGSCWYYIAYILKNEDGTYLNLNSKEARKKINHWLPVDLYIGGQEHAVLHLLYARFWHRFLYKINITDKCEPFKKVINQGMILDSIGKKISKSVGNVISVDKIIEEYGADTLRLYEMFMGPITQSAKWSNESINGMKLWLNKIYRIYSSAVFVENSNELLQEFNRMIKDVTNSIENLQFNIAISKMMVFINECNKSKELPKKIMRDFLIVLSCFAPFISQEIFEKFFEHNKQIAFEKWPTFSEVLIQKERIKIPVQINGKVKEIIEINFDEEQNKIKEIIFKSLKIQNLLKNQKINKEIYIKNKIYNIILS